MKKSLILVILILVSMFATACFATPSSVSTTVLETEATVSTATLETSNLETEATISETESITTPSVNATFPEANPYSEERFQIYINHVRSRDSNSFLTDEEIQLLSNAGFDVHDEQIYRFSHSYFEPQLFSYPVLLSYEGSILLWSIAEDGRLFIQDLDGLEKDQPSHGYWGDENPFGFYENAHYLGSDQIISADRWYTFSYDSKTGLVSGWKLGECVSTFQAAPAGAVFFGYSEIYPGGFIFTLQDKVYCSSIGKDSYELIATNVACILSLDYHYDDIWEHQALFLMTNGELMAYIPNVSGEGVVQHNLLPIKVQ